MKNHRSRINRNWRVPIPHEVLNHLGLQSGDTVSFVIMQNGDVVLKAVKYPILEVFPANTSSRPSWPVSCGHPYGIASCELLKFIPLSPRT
jgi:hypothetical protein